MHIQPLDGDWQVSKIGVDEWIPATVPGSIHTALMAAGKIPDPFWGDNETKIGWVAETDWVYRRSFKAEDALLKNERIFLECDGLDTIATIRLNGKEIARTDNMHRRYEFDITNKIHPGENTLEVEFASPVNYVKEKIGEGLVISPGDSIPGSPYMRKAMYQWGWDWAPKIPTSGIWRHIRLVGYSDGRLKDVRVSQLHGRTRVEVHVEAEIERFTDTELVVHARLTSPDGTILEESDNLQADGTCGVVDFLVDNPALWWPNGYGDQPLYMLEIVVSCQSSVVSKNKSLQSAVCSLQSKIGLRTLELRQEPDEWGKSFYFIVNGVPIFCKGANWIPADHFPARITGDQYRNLIESAASANMNMLRVWGGGIYEDDRFYDLCDEHGILIWQDFAFSCGHYPTDPEMLENIRLEAVDNIRRIRHHPCLALWCGNNEMEWGETDWWPNIPNSEERKQEYGKIFHDLLPKVHSEEDPHTPYWPSTPSSGTPFQNPNGESEGDGHYWAVWHERKPFTAYREHFYRFMSEFGFESMPSLDTVKSFAEPKDWNMTSYIMESHQKNSAGNGLILYYMAHTFRFPKDFSTMVYVSQLLQSEAMRYGVEHWRRNRNGNRCMGTLYWQYNDCWPVASWSGIEYNHHWKALQYYAKRFFAPVLLSAEETSNSAKLHITNDLPTPFSGEVKWSLEKLDGTQLQNGTVQVETPSGSNACVADLNFSGALDSDTRRQVVLVYELWKDGKRLSLGMVSFVPSKHLELPEVKISVEAKGDCITLTSDKTARFVMLDVPGYDIRFSDNFFDLPAGRPVTVSLNTKDIIQKLRITSLRNSY